MHAQRGLHARRHGPLTGQPYFEIVSYVLDSRGRKLERESTPWSMSRRRFPFFVRAPWQIHEPFFSTICGDSSDPIVCLPVAWERKSHDTEFSASDMGQFWVMLMAGRSAGPSNSDGGPFENAAGHDSRLDAVPPPRCLVVLRIISSP